MITFTPSELVFLDQLVSSQPGLAPELSARLQALGPSSGSSVSLELSQETVESILDALPAPGAASPLENQLRGKLSLGVRS